MIAKKFYLTKEDSNGLWNYVGDPLHPNTTMDVGIIHVDRDDIRVDQFGAYVTKFIDVNMTQDWKEKLYDVIYKE